MASISFKLKCHSIIFFIALIVLFILVHLPLCNKYREELKPYYSGKGFEDRSVFFGADFTYYLDGALSIFDFGIEKKFNDKRQPILPQEKRILKTDMAWYAPYILVFYPYPSFKFGYSLTAAFMTGFLPDTWFHYYIHRLMLVNFIIIFLNLILIFLIVGRLTNGYIPTVMACLFFIFDISSAYNSYRYQSHTMSGMFYLLLAYYLFLRSEDMRPLKLGLLSFLLVLSIFSSSHVVPLALFMGLSIYVWACYRESRSRILKYTLAAIVGSSIIPLYIAGVEKWLHFKSLGLPITFAQLANYRNTVGLLIGTFPLHLRFMWDLRLFNIFIVFILVMALFVAIYTRYRSTNNQGFSCRADFIKENRVNKKYYILFFSVLLSNIVVAFYALPISRGMTPYTVLWGILLGIFLGRRFVTGEKVIKALIAVIPLLLFVNFYLSFFNTNAIFERRPSISYQVDYSPSDNIVVINEIAIYEKNTAEFFKSNGNNGNAYPYKIISKSIKEFIKEFDSKIKDQENTYVQFDPMDFAIAYAGQRRFIPTFVPNKNLLVNQKTYLKDFRFIAQVFNLYRKNILTDKDILRKKKLIWNFGLWDQEYHYSYGYCNYVKKYFKGTPLELLDTHYIYYINYGALKNACFRNPDEIEADATAESEPQIIKEG
jgi:hypothetical protein